VALRAFLRGSPCHSHISFSLPRIVYEKIFKYAFVLNMCLIFLYLYHHNPDHFPLIISFVTVSDSSVFSPNEIVTTASLKPIQ
jgi:hypothetical protein